jgi:glycosyl transferase family 2
MTVVRERRGEFDEAACRPVGAQPRVAHLDVRTPGNDGCAVGPVTVPAQDATDRLAYTATTALSSGAVDESEQRIAVQSRSRPSSGDVSVVVTAINETFSLRRTVEILVEENRHDLAEIIIAIAPRTTVECRAVIARLLAEHPDLVWVHTQRKPFVGGAIQEAFDLACGTYVVMMASDLETDPHLVKDLIREIRDSGVDIVTASRWARGGAFTGYHPMKLVLNWTFQTLMRALFLTRLSDMTYGYRIFRADTLRETRWEELKHPFLLETIVKPMRLGRRVREIPVAWTPRTEGESQMTLLTYCGYLRLALKTRFRRRRAARRTV